jgi:hypothetical protein
MKIFFKALFCFALCNIFYNITHAQKNAVVVTLNPFSFAEPDAGFTPGVEYFIGNKVSLLSDVGIIFYDAWGADAFSNSNGNRNNLIGYKVKPELRYYATSQNKVADGFFIGLELLYKHVNYKRNQGVQVFDNVGNFIYTDFRGYNVIKNVIGASAKFGFRAFFTKEENLGLDIYLGLGYRRKTYSTKNVPPGGSVDLANFDGFRFNTDDNNGGTINLPAGLKLIWKF